MQGLMPNIQIKPPHIKIAANNKNFLTTLSNFDGAAAADGLSYS
jgi:hypothetical protein